MALSHRPDPSLLVAESDCWAVLPNADQTLLGRCFLVLKRPETDVTALDDEEVIDLWTMTRHVRAALDGLWSPDHYNFAFLMNVDKQVHFHVIPRYVAPRMFQGQTFTDPSFGAHYAVGGERTLAPIDFAALVAALRARLRTA